MRYNRVKRQLLQPCIGAMRGIPGRTLRTDTKEVKTETQQTLEINKSGIIKHP